MFRFDEDLTVYLHREAIDFRVGLNGLAVLVEQALGLDPFAKAVYVFRNRRRDRVKILAWDRNGDLNRIASSGPTQRRCRS